VSGVPRPLPRRVTLGHVPIDVVDRAEAVRHIAALVEQGEGGLIFTPNVDHIVLAEKDLALREAYASVSLSLVDGMPVLWACRMLGHSVKEKISGSDMISPLMSLAARRGWRVFLLGGAPGVADRAAARLCVESPGLRVVGTSSALVDVRRPLAERRELLGEVSAARPDLVLLALGCPKDELFGCEVRTAHRSAVVLGVGAGLDFLAGTVRRAPAWISACGLEWLFRLVQEPRRLWRRYLVRGPTFLPILLRALAVRYR
jgi:N-acetylglucosaminyldiphosphoundecaprenol N-acetyl-beta-D-mannosaminyltransferase